ncbi:hypothetical protein [Erythrobacter sp.]|uniref:hypothetical protein n=1 Tax=Erythrobacter sp. TaxID=1042 RepID=UPI00345B5C8D
MRADQAVMVVETARGDEEDLPLHAQLVAARDQPRNDLELRGEAVAAAEIGREVHARNRVVDEARILDRAGVHRRIIGREHVVALGRDQTAQRIARRPGAIEIAPERADLDRAGRSNAVRLHLVA